MSAFDDRTQGRSVRRVLAPGARDAVREDERMNAPAATKSGTGIEVTAVTTATQA
jgi:hypothetical protein